MSNQIQTLNIIESFSNLSSFSSREEILLCYLKHFGDFTIQKKIESTPYLFRVEKDDCHYYYRVLKIEEVFSEIKECFIEDGYDIEPNENWQNFVKERIERDGIINYIPYSDCNSNADENIPFETQNFVVVCGVVHYIYRCEAGAFEDDE